MRIQYTERDRHLIEQLHRALDAHAPTSALAKIVGVAVGFDVPEGREQETVSIVSVYCNRCGGDVWGVNPCRVAVDSVGWCGCKNRNCEACASYLSPRYDCNTCGGTGVVRAKRKCDDDGTCHHSCDAGECFRRRHAGPLSETGCETWAEFDEKKAKAL